jgi:hypothetical protein
MLNLDLFEYETDIAAQAAWIAGFVSVAAYALNTSFAGTTTTNQRMVVKGDTISASGSAIKIRLKGHPNYNNTITSAYIGERSGATGNYAAAPTRITFDGGNNSGTIPAGGHITSDGIVFALDETKDYLVHLYMTTNSSGGGVYGSGDGRYFKDNNATDQSDIVDISALSYSSDSYSVGLANLYIDSGIEVTSNTIGVENGTYNMKVVAAETTSLNKTITLTLNPTFNLSGQTEFKLRFKSSRTGSNIKLGMHDSGGTTTELTPDVTGNDFETYTLDISGVTDANKDAIDSLIVTVLNADAENEMYFEFIQADDGSGEAGSGNIQILTSAGWETVTAITIN